MQQRRTKKEKHESPALFQAMRDHDSELVEQLLNENVSPDSEEEKLSALSQAAEYQDYRICELLLSHGADVNFSGRRIQCQVPVFVAAKHNNIPLIELFVKHKADLDLKYFDGNTALLEAVSRLHTEAVKVLIKAGSNIKVSNNGGDTGLHLAAIRGSTVLIKEFLDAGADPNCGKFRGNSIQGNVSNTGIRPLHLTAFDPRGGHAMAAKMLLDAGAEIEATTDSGRTPLHICGMKNAYHVAKVLLEYGCNLNPISMENNEQKTPLMKAIDSGHLEMVTLLVDAGADVAICGVFGVTPLINAIFCGEANITKTLIQAGADVNQKSRNGLSPLEACITKKVPLIVKMLIQSGCHLEYRLIDILHQENCQFCISYPEDAFWLIERLSTPQSLKHCCRNTIRQSLTNKPCLMIKLLPLPGEIKGFLDMSDLGNLTDLKKKVKTC